MPKSIVLHNHRCLGCRSCEAVCSLVNTGEINPAKSRISVVLFLEGKYALPCYFIGNCRQCADAPCLEACPAEAISLSTDETRRIMVSSDRCIGCGKCVRACPFGAMKFDSVLKNVYKCELCGGAPACVDICPAGALEYIRQEPVYACVFDAQMQGHLFLEEQNRENFRKAKKKRKASKATRK